MNFVINGFNSHGLIVESLYTNDQDRIVEAFERMQAMSEIVRVAIDIALPR